MANRVPKTRNAGTMTEAQFWGFVRSKLRQSFRYWKPIQRCLEEAKRPYKGPDRRLKWEYQCKKCGDWYKRSEVQVDHIIPCGSLKCGDDLKGFLERLAVEDGFQVLCKTCHSEKTAKEKEERNENQG